MLVTLRQPLLVTITPLRMCPKTMFLLHYLLMPVSLLLTLVTIAWHHLIIMMLTIALISGMESRSRKSGSWCWSRWTKSGTRRRMSRNS